MSTERAARIAELKSDLAETRAAIRRVLRGGQSIAGEGRAKTNADLQALRTLEKDLSRELAALLGGGGIRIRGVVHR